MMARKRPPATGPATLRDMMLRANQQGRASTAAPEVSAPPADTAGRLPEPEESDTSPPPPVGTELTPDLPQTEVAEDSEPAARAGGNGRTQDRGLAPAATAPLEQAPAPDLAQPAPESPAENTQHELAADLAVAGTPELVHEDGRAEQGDGPISRDAGDEPAAEIAPPAEPADRDEESRVLAERAPSGNSPPPASSHDAQEPAPPAAQLAGRPLAEPFAPDADLVKKSINMAPALLAAAEDWMRARRKTQRRPSLSTLIDAALRDLPTDLEELRKLAASLPQEIFAAGPTQVGVRVQRATLAAVEDAQFELSTIRTRSLPLWHCVSGALANQLAAEGMPVLAGTREQGHTSPGAGQAEPTE